MLKKALLIYAMITVAGMMLACRKNTCKDPETFYYKWTHLQIQQGAAYMGNAGYRADWLADSLMEGRIPVMHLFVLPEKLAMQVSQDAGIFSQAYATDCVPDELLPVTLPSRFYIQTLRTYNSIYPANSDVTSLFAESVLDASGHFTSFTSVDPTIRQVNKGVMEPLSKMVFLTDSSYTDTIQQFRFIVVFNDSTKLSADTRVIRRN